MKLKTLKDMELWECEACGSNIMSQEELRKEAIKWVKACKCTNNCVYCCRTKIFFNITEEDLKDGV